MKDLYDICSPLYKLAIVSGILGLGASGFGLGLTLRHILLEKGRMTLTDIILVSSGALVYSASKFYRYKCEKRYNKMIKDFSTHFQEN